VILQASARRIAASGLGRCPAQGVEVFLCQSIAGIELQRAIQMGDGFLCFAKFAA
jgi:hypothetical protein